MSIVDWLTCSIVIFGKFLGMGLLRGGLEFKNVMPGPTRENKYTKILFLRTNYNSM